MNSLPEILLVAAISFGVGFIAGQLVEFQRVEKKVIPGMNWHVLSDRWLKIAILVLFVLGTSFLINFTVEQRSCNAEFRRTITDLADFAAARDKALYDIPLNDPTWREQTRALFDSYQQKLDARNTNLYPRC